MPEKRTYADRAEYMKKAVTKRRRRLKEMVVEYRGGKCVICGYCKYAGAFDLHHIDEAAKEFALSSHGLTRSWERVKKEADKCALLCANCHRELHGGVTQLPRRNPRLKNEVNCWKSHPRDSGEDNQQPSHATAQRFCVEGSETIPFRE